MPFDGSKQAEKALEVAAQMARHSKSKLVVLSVAESISLPGYPTEAALLQRGIGAMQELELKKAGHVLRKLGVKAEFIPASGHPVDAITRYAKKNKFDLIAMGSKGTGGLKRLLLGSVSEGVVHHAHCAVLMVRE